MKKLIFIAMICLLTACSNGNANETSGSSPAASESAGSSSNAESAPASSASDESATQSQSTEDASTEETKAEITSAPTTNAELYALFMQEWKKGDVTSLYDYSSSVLKSMFDEEAFQYMFCGNFQVFGEMIGLDKKIVKNEIDRFCADYPETERLIDNSFLSDKLKEDYRKIFHTRINSYLKH